MFNALVEDQVSKWFNLKDLFPQKKSRTQPWRFLGATSRACHVALSSSRCVWMVRWARFVGRSQETRDSRSSGRRAKRLLSSASLRSPAVNTVYVYILECVYIYIVWYKKCIYDSIIICAIWIAHTVRKPKKGATKSVGESPPSSEETHAWWEQGDQEPRGSGHIQLQVFPGQNQPAARSTGSTAGELNI